MSDYYDFVEGKIIVGLKDKFSYNMSFLTLIDVYKVETIFHPKEERNKNGIRDVVLIHLQANDKVSVPLAIGKLLTHPYVIFAEPNYLTKPHVIPNDPLFNQLWGMESIKAPSAWDIFISENQDIVVGILDSGIEFSHPDLTPNLIHEGNPYDFPDETGHGTHVAGTIGAVGNNNIGVAGVCWRVGLANFKLGNDTFDLATAIRAINYANINCIPILNNSWGGRNYSAAVEFAIQQYDGLFIASAGNDGTNNDVIPSYPNCYDSENIISVAASTPNNTLTSFSNFGVRNVDIAAPGINILSATLNGNYSFLNGTSMSAPHVSGAAALLKAYMPGLTTLEIKDIILSSAQRHPNLDGRILTGGILDVNAMLKMTTNKFANTNY
ncbi:MAG: S8 family serine peptidase [Defluviitaleaceae bacterium]|nr:S8 family serine peptidase [Defluviitaleaceae bacterium]